MAQVSPTQPQVPEAEAEAEAEAAATAVEAEAQERCPTPTFLSRFLPACVAMVRDRGCRFTLPCTTIFFVAMEIGK